MRGFQPTYAQAIPKNLRPQHIYSNAAIIARNSPLGSIARNSPHGSHSSIEGSRVTFQNLTPVEASVSRVSPDSSEQAPTPTKSILKKPKGMDSLTIDGNMSDRDSQHSQSSQQSSIPSIPKDESRSGSQASSQASSHPSQASSHPSQASSHPSQMSTLPHHEQLLASIEKTYLETSFEFGGLGGSQEFVCTREESENALNSFKSPPAPRPAPPTSNQDVVVAADNLSNSLDKKIRNCTQV